MKFSNLTYYLLTILCLMTTSCVSDGMMDDSSINGEGHGELIEGGNVNFAMTFPTIDAQENNGTDNGTSEERTINDVQIYTFVEGQFVEKIKYVLISGTDGDETRNVMGKLTKTYMSDTAIDFVVIVNAKNIGLSEINLKEGDRKIDLYRLLLFDFNKDLDFAKNIPMWGEGKIESFKKGEVNRGDLTLERAIAKVNVMVNNGNGITDFRITEVEIHKYNTQGYCAPMQDNGPSIPGTSKISTDILSSSKISVEEANNVKNKLYMPEHKNKGVAKENKTYLVIKAMAREKEKSYIIPFSNNGADYDVLRNHMYVFNITSVKMDVTLEYEVKAWEIKNINVPSFD